MAVNQNLGCRSTPPIDECFYQNNCDNKLGVEVPVVGISVFEFKHGKYKACEKKGIKKYPITNDKLGPNNFIIGSDTK